MKILLLAPHPFYQDRGTPIAVDLLLKSLSKRGDEIDVVTYHEGQEVVYPHARVWRIPSLPFVRKIRPGLSWKKVVCDLFMLFKVFQMVSKKRYQLVHAVEESVYIALLLKWFYKIPYVYDMDSSLAQQVVEKVPLFFPVAPLLRFFEGVAVKNAEAVVPVCDALSHQIERYRPKNVVVLHDPPLLDLTECREPIGLKEVLGTSGLLVMYVGNLETYQGIDLLLEGFALALKGIYSADLVVIGGAASDIEKYRRKSLSLGIHKKVHFLGPKPVASLAAYLLEADILVSPRIKGKNTPMKIYSYLQSGKPVLATDLPTHTQVLDERVAFLTSPDLETFAAGMISLMEKEDLRRSIGAAGKRLVEEKYGAAVFHQKVNDLYDQLKKTVGE